MMRARDPICRSRALVGFVRLLVLLEVGGTLERDVAIPECVTKGLRQEIDPKPLGVGPVLAVRVKEFIETLAST